MITITHEQQETKLKVGIFKIRGNIWLEGDPDKETSRIYFRFPYNQELIDEIKCFEGARWHGYDKPLPKKLWSITNTQRNLFQLQYLQHAAKPDEIPDPYERYNRELVEWQSQSGRPLYEHQVEGVRFVLTRRQCILAYDLGIGKTLLGVEIVEELIRQGLIKQRGDVYWVSPKSGLAAVQYDLERKWKSQIQPMYFTYEGLKGFLETSSQYLDAPKIVLFDECQKVKNPTAQRSQAAKHLADQVRKRWGDDGYIVPMSGSPAPKSPLDWWWICEIACPGFLREGTYQKFYRRLALVVQKENSKSGGSYPERVTWWDDENKCVECGQIKESFGHDQMSLDGPTHQFKKSTNQVSLLYKRMKGLTLVKFKHECLDLPEKIFRRITCEPTPEVLRAAQLIVAGSSTTIKALILLRELSDGFQYREQPQIDAEGEVIQQQCPLCFGKGKIAVPEPDTDCPKCGGKKTIDTFERIAEEVPCPKEAVLRDLLDEYEDEGRVVLYAGFTGSVDRLVRVVGELGWNYIRVDGRGWTTDLPIRGPLQMQDAFNNKDFFDKIAFIGQPSAGGIGLNLSASPVEIFYSNDFNGDSRIQAVERAHRPGMDLNKGCTILDLIHLDTDLKVLTNLEEKRELQAMTLGDLKTTLEIQEREEKGSGIRYL